MNHEQKSQSRKWGLFSTLVFLPVLTALLVLSAPAVFSQDSADDGLSGSLSGQSNPLNPGSQVQGGIASYSQSGMSTASAGNDVQSHSTSLQDGTLQGSDFHSVQGQQDFDSLRRNNLLREQYSQLMLQNLPTDPPTEFQDMVLSSTGKRLPIYGEQLFRNVPSTFAPLDRVPVTPDYVIGPGDELLVQIWGQVRFDSHLTVDRMGDIYIPQVGSVHVAGLTFGQLREHLKEQTGRVFRNFDLNVDMGQLRSIQIFVVGQARRPGSYTVSSLSTLVDAIFVTGGPKPQGSMRHILLKRAGKAVVDFDLYDLLQQGDKTNDARLLPGDVIYIPPVGPQVAVAGSVNMPAIYELKDAQGETVEHLLDLAAGPTNVAANDRARLERVDAHRMRSVIDLSLSSNDRMKTLQDGDILEVFAIVDQYKNGVTLRGNVANPGHYAWHEGMRLADLFPEKDALITRDYWLRRGQLGKPVLTYIPVCPPQPAGMSTIRSHVQSNGVYGAENDPSDINSNEFSRNSPAYIQYPQNVRDNSPSGYGSIDPNDLEGCIDLPGNMPPQELSPNVSRLPIDSRMQSQYNQQVFESQSQKPRADLSGASSASAMVSRAPDEFQPRNDVRLSEPDIDWTYAVIERQDPNTLTTSLIPFNLGKLVLDKDQEQNLLLQPSDVVTIFSKADFRVPQAQQTRLVHLEGEFKAAGVYSVQPGETLRDLVKRAGGFTPDAYLYGSEFTRESTRRVQQQRLNEYIDQIALQAGTNSVNNASRSVSALDTAAASAMAAQSQNVIDSLRQARSTGRIVLELAPESKSVDQLPAIPLEDGDRFIVPQVPSTVSVAGAVYNANSFIYDSQRRLKDYLQLAGGSNRNADRRSVYVIRADGSVISRREVSYWNKDSFDFLRIYRGDTVVVPLNLSKGASLRTVVDVAQIVGQFGVAIAAANLVF